MFGSESQILCYMALDGFTALMFVPSSAEVLAEIEKTILHCVLPPRSPIGAFTQCHLKYGLL